MFSRAERNGIILLVALILAMTIAKDNVVDKLVKEHPASQNDRRKIAQLQWQIDAARTTYGNNKQYADAADERYNNTASMQSKTTSFNTYKDFKIEVNAATAADYEKLYGIGKVYSERIVKFRDKLGGFYSIEQLKDVYGIQDSVYQKFKQHLTIKPAKVHQLNINAATYEELTANPYFFSTIAKQIIGYRTKVKPFESLEDIKKLYFVRDHPDQYDKLAPYVSFN